MAAAIIAARNAYISAKDHRMRNMTTHHQTDLPWLREFIAESQSLGFTDEAKPPPTTTRHRCFAAGDDARLPAWYRRAASGARRVVHNRAFEASRPEIASSLLAEPSLNTSTGGARS